MELQRVQAYLQSKSIVDKEKAGALIEYAMWRDNWTLYCQMLAGKTDLYGRIYHRSQAL